MTDKTYADLTAQTTVEDADLLATWRPSGPGPLKKLQSSIFKAYVLADIGTAAAEDIGTSGHTVPLLDAANAWSSPQVFTGISNGDEPASGKVGQFMSSNIVSGSAVSLTSATATNVTYLDLTAGIWIVFGNAIYGGNATGALNALAWTSTTSATLPTPPNGGGYQSVGVPDTNSLSGFAVSAGLSHFNVSSTTRVYLSGYSSYTGGSANVYGFIGALRVA